MATRANPRKPRYPLTNAQIIETVNGSMAAGYDFRSAVWPELQSIGYKNIQQVGEQLAGAGWNEKQIEKGLSYKPGGLSQWWNSLKQGVAFPVFEQPVAAAGAGGAAAGGGAAAVKSAIPGSTLGKAALFGGVGAAITSPLDFLKFIAWIFHPRNILRAVEFVVGLILMIFGFNAALQARGERIEGFSTSESALTRSELGRVANSLGAAIRTRERPQRPRSAPHRTRQRALTQRYRREEDLQRRRAKAPRPKKSK